MRVPGGRQRLTDIHLGFSVEGWSPAAPGSDGRSRFAAPSGRIHAERTRHLGECCRRLWFAFRRCETDLSSCELFQVRTFVPLDGDMNFDFSVLLDGVFLNDVMTQM